VENLTLDCRQDGIAAEKFKELDSFIQALSLDLKSPRRKGDLIQILHKAQDIFGFLPESVQLFVSQKLNIQHSEVSGVISFYNYFTTEPKGRIQVSVCMGTACFVKGAGQILSEFEKQLGIKAGQVSEDMKFSIDIVRCIGACGLAPVVTIDKKVYGRLKPDDVRGILAEYHKMQGGEL
jgi:NADH:ubiquinone oxidoreductase subunit E